MSRTNVNIYCGSVYEQVHEPVKERVVHLFVITERALGVMAAGGLGKLLHTGPGVGCRV